MCNNFLSISILFFHLFHLLFNEIQGFLTTLIYLIMLQVDLSYFFYFQIAYIECRILKNIDFRKLVF